MTFNYVSGHRFANFCHNLMLILNNSLMMQFISLFLSSYYRYMDFIRARKQCESFHNRKHKFKLTSQLKALKIVLLPIISISTTV